MYKKMIIQSCKINCDIQNWVQHWIPVENNEQIEQKTTTNLTQPDDGFLYFRQSFNTDVIWGLLLQLDQSF